MTRRVTFLMAMLVSVGAATGQLPRPAGQGMHEPFAPPMTAAKIRAAIDDAVMYLRGRQGKDGYFAFGSGGGGTALAALTLLATGADPASDEQLRKALQWLADHDDNNTYVRGIRANVWEYALRKASYDKSMRAMLKKDFDWLLKALGDREGWRYTMQSRDWDNSCTQYGVLGIWAAARNSTSALATSTQSARICGSSERSCAQPSECSFQPYSRLTPVP
ncbi:hypothetical protein LCGC14_3009270 [marine sediment metagenome]|uniref:Squalene cyclase C-terminal domain-containing protein n=1 Tax=marine sediment metagenome TaxID=412755 RepID=A0A0F8Z6E1_9ZZZZ